MFLNLFYQLDYNNKKIKKKNYKQKKNGKHVKNIIYINKNS